MPASEALPVICRTTGGSVPSAGTGRASSSRRNPSGCSGPVVPANVVDPPIVASCPAATLSDTGGTLTWAAPSTTSTAVGRSVSPATTS